MAKLSTQDQKGINDLIYRVLRVSADKPPKWGTMSASEMLKHCTAVNHMALQAVQSTHTETVRQKLFRMIFLYLPVRFPRNVKAPKSVLLLTNGKEKETFEKEREKYIELISRFPMHTFPSKIFHPVFGNLTPSQWGILNWMHMDHHLRQFGV